MVTSVVRQALLDPETIFRVVLAGTRHFDPAEQNLIPLIQPDPALRLRTIDLFAPENVGAALSMLKAREVYLHIDLDVLDPSQFAGPIQRNSEHSCPSSKQSAPCSTDCQAGNPTLSPPLHGNNTAKCNRRHT